ncbi:ParA family protein [Flexilinea flocculi]|jgi:chromosome partitioning protein|uniref:Cellulose biosynthesis protein BcsQ n=1 Tax=Flexilinea flocculi TaxID=1678840 RepID=A0A0S7BLU8_9CHLR|nr:AAA family ATPase [Flexilinea flocculi]GAP41292.1 cellulose biosynthesis protein BcsQ [Flexilinea flocculi]
MINQKGGVGKTTTAINLGASLASYGQKILVIDMDPQANATSSIGLDKNEIKKGTYEVLIGSAPISPQIIRNNEFHISILPSSPALSGAEIELIDFDHRESLLKNAIDQIAVQYDYIIIDCPPSLSLLTINALVAAKDGVIIPVQCEYLALEGLGQLTSTINQVKKTFPSVNVRGVVLTMFDGRTRLAIDVVNEVRKFFPDKVFESIIPRSIRLAEAPSYGQPINFYSKESNACKAYNELAKEILIQDGIQISS